MKRKLSKQMIAAAGTVAMAASFSLGGYTAPVKDVEAASCDLTFQTSSTYLQNAFDWAKEEALSKVHTGEGENYPCYQAALQDRPAFCQRDFAHQVDGAALLGLDEENFSMLKLFAQNQKVERDNYYSLWEINYDGKPTPCDYEDDDHMWKNLCGMFETVENGYRQYQWTGNNNLINDTELNNYYSKTLNEFIQAHDKNLKDGIAEGVNVNGWSGDATYHEGVQGKLLESADGITTQYRANEAYAKILEAKGDSNATEYYERANALRNTYNTDWYSTTEDRPVRGKLESNHSNVTDFGYEGSLYPLYKNLMHVDYDTEGTEYQEALRRVNRQLDFVYDNFVESPNPNIEAWTYYPDTFYNWNQNARAWSFLKHVIDSRSDYPEVSFTIISAIATGMMGISPDAPENKVTTLPRLPEGDPTEVSSVDMDHIKIGSHDIGVTHRNNNYSSVTHNSGQGKLTWEAQFAGDYDWFMVNGTKRNTSKKYVNGTKVSYVTIELNPGQTFIAFTPDYFVEQKEYQPITNIIENGSFENGFAHWNIPSSGVGTSRNNKFEGKYDAYLDAAYNNEISQTITIPENGYYSFSSYVAASSNGSTFGIESVGDNSKSIACLDVKGDEKYHFYCKNAVYLKKNEQVKVYITSTPNGWVNIDDVRVTNAYNEFENGGFEDGNSHWLINGGELITDNANTGTSHVRLSDGQGQYVKQSIKVGTEGDYSLRVIQSPHCNYGAFCGIKVNINGTQKQFRKIYGSADYNCIELNDISVQQGDTVEIIIEGPYAGYVDVDDILLSRNVDFY